MSYQWFSIVSETDFTFEQGDFIRDCPIVTPPDEIKEGQVSDVTVSMMDVVLLTQSCDLAHGKSEILLVCPYYALPIFENANANYKQKSEKEKLRKGLIPAYHLINKCELKGFENDFVVVDFRNIYGVHRKFIDEYVKKLGKRVRLLPPYREHLSQSFARYFMRVGLPIDIPQFK